MFVISFMKDSFIQYSGIPVFSNLKENENWFQKLGVREIAPEKSWVTDCYRYTSVQFIAKQIPKLVRVIAMLGKS